MPIKSRIVADNALGAPEACRPDAVTRDWDLQVKQEADIWSLGCIFSEVATWVGHGYNNLIQYREERRAEFKSKTYENGDCFHGLDNQLLDAVNHIHHQMLTNCRVNDYVTPSVIVLVKEMLLADDARPGAKSLWDKTRWILMDAEKAINKSKPVRNESSQIDGTSLHDPADPPSPATPNPHSHFLMQSSANFKEAQQQEQTFNKSTEAPADI